MVEDGKVLLQSRKHALEALTSPVAVGHVGFVM